MVKTISAGQIEEILTATPLPKGTKWYSAGPRKVFQIKDGYIFYAIRPSRNPKKYFKYGFRINNVILESSLKRKIEKGLKTFENKIKKYDVKTVNMNGGDLGLGGTK